MAANHVFSMSAGCQWGNKKAEIRLEYARTDGDACSKVGQRGDHGDDNSEEED